MCSSIFGSTVKNCTDSFFKGHYIWHQNLCFGRAFAVCFTAKLVIISYLTSGIQHHKDHTVFSLLGDMMQIINTPTHIWTYLYKPCLQDRLQQIPSWEYGLVTSNLTGGPLNQVTAPWSETHPKAASPYKAHPSAQGRWGDIYICLQQNIDLAILELLLKALNQV